MYEDETGSYCTFNRLIFSLNGYREYIFRADRKPSESSIPQTANMALKRMGFEGELVAHGLCSIASTTLNPALAHVDKNKVRRAYNRAGYL